MVSSARQAAAGTLNMLSLLASKGVGMLVVGPDAIVRPTISVVLDVLTEFDLRLPPDDVAPLGPVVSLVEDVGARPSPSLAVSAFYVKNGIKTAAFLNHWAKMVAVPNSQFPTGLQLQAEAACPRRDGAGVQCNWHGIGVGSLPARWLLGG